MFSVKLSQLAEDSTLEESGLQIALADLGLEEPFLGSGLDVDYSLRRIQDKVIATVKAHGSMKLACSRCLKDFVLEADSEFFSQFEPLPKDPNPRNGLDPEDPEFNVVFFEGDQLPLGEEIRQEMLVRIPFAPLCTADCKGLCAVCGGDKNIHPCHCETQSKEGPFSGLKKLFNPSKEN